MTKHTARDKVWDQALQRAMAEESFKVDRIRGGISVDVSDRTIRDTLNTMVDQGWLSKETPHAHEWAPGPRARGEDVDESPSATELASKSDLTKGEVYSGVVDRVSSNAIIELESGHINLGPIDDAAEGERVEFEYVGGVWGRCLNGEYTYESYSPRDGQSSSSSSSRSSSKRIHSSGDLSDPANKNKLLKGKL